MTYTPEVTKICCSKVLTDQVVGLVGYIQRSISEIDSHLENKSYSNLGQARYRASAYMRVILTITQQLDEIKTAHERNRTD